MMSFGLVAVGKCEGRVVAGESLLASVGGIGET